MQELVQIIISRNGLQKVINATEYTYEQFCKTCLIYSNANYEMQAVWSNQKLKKLLKHRR